MSDRKESTSLITETITTKTLVSMQMNVEGIHNASMKERAAAARTAFKINLISDLIEMGTRQIM